MKWGDYFFQLLSPWVAVIPTHFWVPAATLISGDSCQNVLAAVALSSTVILVMAFTRLRWCQWRRPPNPTPSGRGGRKIFHPHAKRQKSTFTRLPVSSAGCLSYLASIFCRIFSLVSFSKRAKNASFFLRKEDIQVHKDE